MFPFPPFLGWKWCNFHLFIQFWTFLQPRPKEALLWLSVRQTFYETWNVHLNMNGPYPLASEPPKRYLGFSSLFTLDMGGSGILQSPTKFWDAIRHLKIKRHTKGSICTKGSNTFLLFFASLFLHLHHKSYSLGWPWPCLPTFGLLLSCLWNQSPVWQKIIYMSTNLNKKKHILWRATVIFKPKCV